MMTKRERAAYLLGMRDGIWTYEHGGPVRDAVLHSGVIGLAKGAMARWELDEELLTLLAHEIKDEMDRIERETDN